MIKYRLFILTSLLLLVFTGRVNADEIKKYSAESLTVALKEIPYRDKEAESALQEILTSVRAAQQPKLEAKTLLHLLKTQFLQKKYDRVKDNYQLLLEISKEKQLNSLMVQGLLVVAQAERASDNRDLAVQMLEQEVIPLAKQYVPKILARAYLEIAHISASNSDFERFEPYFTLAIESYKSQGNFKLAAQSLAEKGSYLASFGNIKAALPALISAAQYQLELDDKEGLFVTYRSLGRLNHEVGNYQQALNYFQQAYNIGNDRANGMASLYFSMAHTHYELEQYNDSLAYINKAQELMVKSGRKKNIATVMLGKTSILLKKQDYPLMLSTLEEATVIAKQVNAKLLNEDLQLSWAKYYFAIKNIPAAKKALEIALAIETPRISMNIDKYEIAKDIYQQAGDHKTALIYFDKLRELELEKAKTKDEERIVQQQNEISLLNAQKNTAIVKQELLEKQNQVQQQEAQQQELWFYSSLTILSILVLFSYIYLSMRQKKRLALEQSKATMALMEQKNHFIANVAHDLKNPLTVIQVHLEALKDGMVKNPETAHDILQQRIGVLTNIIDDLRQVTLAEMGSLSLNKKQMAIKPWLMQELVAYNPLVAAKNLSLTSSITLESSAMINADVDRLSQVIANIIKNSLRYTHQPGRIYLTAQQSNRRVELVIQDSTPAVKEEELQQLFDHSYRSELTKHMSNQGSGLGLYICKEIIEAHQGTISASLAELGGLKITISLPLTDENDE